MNFLCTTDRYPDLLAVWTHPEPVTVDTAPPEGRPVHATADGKHFVVERYAAWLHDPDATPETFVVSVVLSGHIVHKTDSLVGQPRGDVTVRWGDSRVPADVAAVLHADLLAAARRNSVTAAAQLTFLADGLAAGTPTR